MFSLRQYLPELRQKELVTSHDQTLLTQRKQLRSLSLCEVVIHTLFVQNNLFKRCVVPETVWKLVIEP